MSVELQFHAPVTWLASYPRSGNTLLRVILKHCFGQASQSIYSDAEFSDPALCAMVGHEPVGDDPNAFIQQARQDGRSLYVKTHGLPAADRHPAIVVRDGRSAVVSHVHFLRDILHRDAPLDDVICGRQGVSWSQHVRAWALEARPGTLVVRYEDLAAGDPQTLANISAFIGQPQQNAFDVSFDELHALSPAFFRRGSDSANVAELDAPAAALFEQLHGETMRALGYGKRIRGGAARASA